MSLLREIQDAVTSGDQSVAVALRKAKILAYRLNHQALKEWVDFELSGYPSKENLPEYRIVPGRAQGMFVGAYGKRIENGPIPESVLPKGSRDLASTNYLVEGVSVYEELLKSSPGEDFSTSWPVDVARHFGSKAYVNMQCLQAWTCIPRSGLIGLVNTVRDKLLGFVLEIEAQNPLAGEAMPGETPISPEKVNQVFNTYILGGTNNVASGGRDFSQVINVEVQQGNLDSLKTYLLKHGVATEDLVQLERAIQEDGPVSSQEGLNGLGDKVKSWMGTMTLKAMSGAWAIGSGAAGGVLANAICRYYGLM